MASNASREEPSAEPAESAFTYRRALVSELMNCIAAGESSALVGVAGVGKSALLRYLRRPEVKEHFLGADGARVLFVGVDCNQLAEWSEWGLYECMLNQITQTLEWLPQNAEGDLVQELRTSHWEIESNPNRLVAQRQVSRSVGRVLQDAFDKMVFFLDEFDGVVRQLDFQLFNNLRGLRDEFHPNVGYVTLTRQFFPMVRKDFDREAEGWYEIISRHVYGLTPYRPDDARRVVSELIASAKTTLHEAEIAYLITATGGHAGLLKAAFVFLSRTSVASSREALSRLARDPVVMDECRKIWNSLIAPEQQVLARAARRQGLAPSDWAVAGHLKMKGMLVEKERGDWMLFSPLFADYVRQKLPS